MDRAVEKLGIGTDAEPAAAADTLAPLSLKERLSAEIVSLKELDLDGLRARWRKLFRAPAPPHLPKYLLFRVLAYRIQANALGDLDRETVRFLDQVARDSEQRRAAAGYRRSKAAPPVPPVPNRRELKPGTILVRE